MRRKRWIIRPKYQIVVETTFNKSPTKPENSSVRLWDNIIDISKSYQISPIYVSRYRDLIFNLFSHLLLNSFDVSTRSNSPFEAIHCIRLKRKYRRCNKHHSIEIIFKISDSINEDITIYPNGYVPIFHKISINGNDADDIFEGIEIMHQIHNEILRGDYSSTKSLDYT